MATEPSILLLDEPAAGLDENSTEELISHVRRLAEERGVGVLLIEHDVSMVMRTCDRVVAINFGEEIVTGTPAEVRAHPVVISAYLGRAEAAAHSDVPAAPSAAPAVRRLAADSDFAGRPRKAVDSAAAAPGARGAR
jgi:sulfate-transporting ATPase